MPYKDKSKNKIRERRRYWEHKLAGICVECDKPAVAGKCVCEKHLTRYREKSRRRNKINYQHCIDNRLCVRCWTPLEEDEGRTCMNCSGRKTRGEMTYAAHTARIAA